jgi:hypothetical protein
MSGDTSDSEFQISQIHEGDISSQSKRSCGIEATQCRLQKAINRFGEHGNLFDYTKQRTVFEERLMLSL